jgi:PST family polysaccharide transporter
VAKVKPFLLLGLTQLFAGLTPLVAIPFALTTYSSAEFSLFALTLTLGTIFSLITDFGYTNLGTRHIAINSHRSQFCVTYMIGAGVERSLLAILLAPILYAVLLYTKYSDDAVILVFIALLYPIGLSVMPVWAYQGLEKISLMCVVNIFTRLMMLLIFISFKSDLNAYYAAAMFGAQWLVSGLIFHTLNSSHSPFLLKKIFAEMHKNFSFKFGEAKFLYLSNICVFLYTSLNILICGFLFSDADFNFLFTLDRYVKGFLMVLPPAMGVLLPTFSRWFLANDDEAKNALFMVCKWSSIIILCVLIIVNAISLHYFENSELGYMALVYSLIALPISLSTILGVLGMVSSGRSRELFFCVSPAALSNVILIYPAILYFGMLGAIFIMILAEVIVLLNLVWFSKRKVII